MPKSPLVLALTALLLLGLVVPTGASSGDQLWTDPAVVVAPGTGPGGDYARLNADGELEVDLTGPAPNAGAVTVVEGVFTVSNEDDESVAVWFSHDAMDAVVLSVDGRSAQRESDPLVLRAGEQVSVDLTVDTGGHAAGDGVLSEFTIHADELSSGDGGSGSSTTVPSTGGTATTEPTEPPTSPTEADPTPPAGDDAVVYADGLEPAATFESLDPARASTIEAPAGFEGPPRASIDPAPTLDGPTVIRPAEGADGLVDVGEPVGLSGHRTVFDSVRAIQPDGRVARLVDVRVPAGRADERARVRLAVDRDALAGADPTTARIGRLTGAGWQLLPTAVVEADRERVVLEALTPGFSVFAVFPDPAVDYDWRLADEAVAGTGAIETRFEAPGEHRVTLAVTDARGRTATTTYDLVANDRPTVAIEVPGTVEPGEPVTLRAAVSDRVGETTVTWRFEDGTTVVGPSVERTFPAGERTIQVVVTDEHGARVTDSVTLAVGDVARTGRATREFVRLGLATEHRVLAAALAIFLLLAALRGATTRPRRSRRREVR